LSSNPEGVQADFDKYQAGEAQGRYPKPAPEAKGNPK